jgi:hypothetical protein
LLECIERTDEACAATAKPGSNGTYIFRLEKKSFQLIPRQTGFCRGGLEPGVDDLGKPLG